MPALADRRLVRHDLRMRVLEVAATSELPGPLRRVTLRGDDLAGFSAPGPADHVKVFFPDPATGLLHLPSYDGAGDRVAPAGPLIARDYTPVAFRPDADGGPELDLDIVLHGDAGPASAWAARATPGDRLGVAGPRGSWLPPADAAHVVLVADESALPAARRWLDALDGIPVTGLFFVEDPATAAYLDGSPGDLRWFTGAGRVAALDAALRGLDPGAGAFWALAGEAGALVAWRRHLRRERGLSASEVDADGYWKRGVADRDHHEPLDPDDAD